jgi:hypothetical protein
MGAEDLAGLPGWAGHAQWGVHAAAPFVAACTLLAAAGVAKLARPDGARDAMRASRLPSSRAAVRTVGALEAATALAGVVLGGTAALAVAAWYLLLAAVASRLSRRAPGTACGCLGAARAPVTRAHVALDLAAAAVAVVASGAGSPLARAGDLPLAGVPHIVLAACCARLAALVIDALPALHAAARPGRPLQEGTT